MLKVLRPNWVKMVLTNNALQMSQNSENEILLSKCIFLSKFVVMKEVDLLIKKLTQLSN